MDEKLDTKIINSLIRRYRLFEQATEEVADLRRQLDQAKADRAAARERVRQQCAEWADREAQRLERVANNWREVANERMVAIRSAQQQTATDIAYGLRKLPLEEPPA